MSKYAGTKTEANLRAAFAGESQARNQYTFFASVAKKEGYEQMAALFLKTAENEKEHAKLWLKELAGIGDTKANLAAAAWSPRSRSTMRSATAPCCTIWRRRRSLKRARSRSGSAATAGTSSSARRRRRSAPPAAIRRAILSCGKRTTEK